MGRLTGDDLTWMYGHLKPNYHQLARKDRLWFAFANQSEGRKGHDIITRVYSDYYVKSGDVGNYTDFNIKFSSQAAAEWVLADIQDSFREYNTYHPSANMGGQAGTGSSPDPTDPDPGPDDDKEKAIDWITYIIIGAAVVAIIILLWPNKRRK